MHISISRLILIYTKLEHLTTYTPENELDSPHVYIRWKDILQDDAEMKEEHKHILLNISYIGLEPIATDDKYTTLTLHHIVMIVMMDIVNCTKKSHAMVTIVFQYTKSNKYIWMRPCISSILFARNLFFFGWVTMIIKPNIALLRFFGRKHLKWKNINKSNTYGSMYNHVYAINALTTFPECTRMRAPKDSH